MKCSNCGLPIFVPPDPYRCKKCNAIICSPYLRDCWDGHWRVRHLNRPRRVVEVKGP